MRRIFFSRFLLVTPIFKTDEPDLCRSGLGIAVLNHGPKVWIQVQIIRKISQMRNLPKRREEALVDLGQLRLEGFRIEVLT